MTPRTDCQHEVFEALCTVNRLEDTGQFHADVSIHCSQCGTPFEFVGLPGGLSYDNPTCSFDLLEARLPIRPRAQRSRKNPGRVGR